MARQYETMLAVWDGDYDPCAPLTSDTHAAFTSQAIFDTPAAGKVWNTYNNQVLDQMDLFGRMEASFRIVVDELSITNIFTGNEKGRIEETTLCL